MKPSERAKTRISIGVRVKPSTVVRIAVLAKELDITKTAVIERAVLELARRQQVDV